MNRDAEAAALTCGSLFLQQFRFFLDHCQKYQRFFSATGNGMAAAVLAERRHARLHRICFVIILIYSLPGQNVIHFRLAVMLMVRELIARSNRYFCKECHLSGKAFAFQQFFCCVSVCHCSRPRFRNLSSVNLHRRIAQCRDVFPVVAGQKNRFSFLF